MSGLESLLVLAPVLKRTPSHSTSDRGNSGAKEAGSTSFMCRHPRNTCPRETAEEPTVFLSWLTGLRIRRLTGLAGLAIRTLLSVPMLAVRRLLSMLGIISSMPLRRTVRSVLLVPELPLTVLLRGPAGIVWLLWGVLLAVGRPVWRSAVPRGRACAKALRRRGRAPIAMVWRTLAGRWGSVALLGWRLVAALVMGRVRRRSAVASLRMRGVRRRGVVAALLRVGRVGGLLVWALVMNVSYRRRTTKIEDRVTRGR